MNILNYNIYKIKGTIKIQYSVKSGSHSITSMHDYNTS
jgi:hypothetical protein